MPVPLCVYVLGESDGFDEPAGGLEVTMLLSGFMLVEREAFAAYEGEGW